VNPGQGVLPRLGQRNSISLSNIRLLTVRRWGIWVCVQVLKYLKIVAEGISATGIRIPAKLRNGHWFVVDWSI